MSLALRWSKSDDPARIVKAPNNGNKGGLNRPLHHLNSRPSVDWATEALSLLKRLSLTPPTHPGNRHLRAPVRCGRGRQTDGPNLGVIRGMGRGRGRALERKRAESDFIPTPASDSDRLATVDIIQTALSDWPLRAHNSP